jgi:hypothetical protein
MLMSPIAKPMAIQAYSFLRCPTLLMMWMFDISENRSH